jgi:hypothetical protein
MKPMKVVAAAFAFGLLLPAIAFAQKTSFDYDKNADFTKYKTYTLKDGTPVGDPLIDKRIVDALAAELAAKGLTRNDANPDLAIVYHVAFDKKQDIQTFSTGIGYGPYGYGWGGGWGTTDVRVIEILMGTLVIDFADTGHKEIVFRGIGVKEVNVQAKPEKRDKSIAEAVKKILKNYPPKPKKK